MSKQPAEVASGKAPQTTKAPAAKPRAAFAAATFGNLRSAAGEGRGEPLRILLVDIDEDPDQPRTFFDDGELESMAESIKTHGVVQPIVVRPPLNGRYLLTFGARRLRASKLAGVVDIPAVISTAGGDATFATQMIENQQRADLSNSDLAAAIARLASEGSTNKQIAAICSLKDYQVAAFRQVDKFPPELVARIDNADMRALYDLFRQWSKTPAAVVDALPEPDAFITVTDARRIIGGITGKPTGSIVLDREESSPTQPPAAAEPPPAEVLSSVAEAPAPPHAVTAPASSLAPQETSKAKKPTEPQVLTQQTAGPVFMVAAGDGQTGRLVTDRRGERAGSALVAYDTGVEEVEAADLRIVSIE